MEFVNLKDASDRVSFAEAVRRGLGRNQGLYFPEHIQPFAEPESILGLDFQTRSARILARLTGLEEDQAQGLVDSAFDFPVRQVRVAERVHALELFHGPSLAFKDFGARFLAACLAAFSDGSPATILTATSGDTGAAVAHARLLWPARHRVVILYPKAVSRRFGKSCSARSAATCTRRRWKPTSTPASAWA